jgi:hypothetical protein
MRGRVGRPLSAELGGGRPQLIPEVGMGDADERLGALGVGEHADLGDPERQSAHQPVTRGRRSRLA